MMDKFINTLNSQFAKATMDMQEQLAKASLATQNNVQALLAPIANRIAALEERDNDLVGAADPANYPDPNNYNNWVRTDDPDFQMGYTAADIPRLDGFAVMDDSTLAPPPFLEDIFRRVHQIPDGIEITHHTPLAWRSEMFNWFDEHFFPNYHI